MLFEVPKPFFSSLLKEHPRRRTGKVHCLISALNAFNLNHLLVEITQKPVGQIDVVDTFDLLIVLLLTCFVIYTFEFLHKSLKVLTDPRGVRSLRRRRWNWHFYFFLLILLYASIIIIWFYESSNTGVAFEITTKPESTAKTPQFLSPNKTCFLSLHVYISVHCKYQG